MCQPYVFFRFFCASTLLISCQTALLLVIKIKKIPFSIFFLYLFLGKLTLNIQVLRSNSNHVISF